MWQKHFYKQQMNFILSDAWQRWLIAANGTGKTLLLYWNIVEYLLGIHPKQFADPPLRCRVLVPSFDNVEDVALEKLLEPQIIQPRSMEVGPLLPKSMIKKGYTKDHKTIDLLNGSYINFVTQEQGWQFMRGREQDLLVMDEESDERVWDENKRGLRNAKGHGKILGGLTPPYEEGKGPSWTKEKVVDAAMDDPDIEVFHACMADNPAITQKFIERFSKGKTKEQIDVQVFGKYPSWGKRIHWPWQNTYWNSETYTGHILPADHPLPENWDADWYMAFDWHQSKPCAAIWAYRDHDGNIVVFDELDKQLAEEKSIADLAVIFQQIEGFPGDKRKWVRYQDPSAKSKYNALLKGFNAWDEFRRNGIVTAEGRNRDPEAGISIVNDYLRGNTKDHPRLFVKENCRYVRQYMDNHYWKRKGDSNDGTPDPKWSDYPICIRYILQELGWREVSKRSRSKWPLVSFSPRDDGRKIVDLSRWI